MIVWPEAGAPWGAGFLLRAFLLRATGIDRGGRVAYLTSMQRIICVVLFAVILVPSGWAQQHQVPESQMQVQLSYAPLVEKTAPAVVNIYTRKIITNRQVTPLFNDPFFRRFFGDFGLPLEKGKRERQNTLGSGVIVRSDGLIVTNEHVIEGADKVIVVLSDQRQFDAELVVSDDKSDLAVLKINPEGEALPALELMDSDDVKVGDLVLAIGNPFGVGQTVTSGIVSAVARTIATDTILKSFIQTDAAINPGNSGGALVSMDGRLVGVNTSIYSQSGGSLGIGFAVPSNMVRAVVNGMTADGRLVRPWLGAYGQKVTSDIASSIGMRVPQGVIVNQVHEAGSAGAAGLRPGDIILAVNGHDVFGPEELAYRIATLPVGDQAVLRIRRGAETLALTTDLSPPPNEPEANLTELKGRHPLAGAVVANLSPAIAERHNLHPFNSGVVILKIRRGGVADRLEFLPGDLVRQINGHDVAQVSDIGDAVKDGGVEWRIRVERDGKPYDLIFRG